MFQKKFVDFSSFAKNYKSRVGYPKEFLRALLGYFDLDPKEVSVVEIGAGTGKFTEMLIGMGFSGYAIEPSQGMRDIGIEETTKNSDSFQWLDGTAENTRLPDSSFDWIFMASSFHLVDYEIALKEFSRILKPHGIFTAVWNSRDINKSLLEQKIEAKVKELAPNLKRVSSGRSKDYGKIITSTGDFKMTVYVESFVENWVDRDRYLNIWRSVQDLQDQLGKEKFQELLDLIEKETLGTELVYLPHQIMSWTAQVKERR